ncbi:MAG TPA: HD domain-containing protein [Alphaproteobacteria bacterium]|nr:HD domain-containing protein [Alphaproteobacteria bacterium]
MNVVLMYAELLRIGGNEMTAQKEENRYRKTVCVDFDGTLVKLSKDFEQFEKVLPGAREALHELKRLGCKIIIHTARPHANGHLNEIADYLEEESIPFDEININSECEWESIKPLAHLYIDDRALRFEGDWESTLVKAKRHLGFEQDGRENNCLTYQQILDKVKTRKKEIAKFEDFLRKETSWETSPASTRFHLCCKGGLIEHSINVVSTILKMRSMLAPEISEESCVIAALYHDVGKVGMPGQPYYLPNPSEWHIKNRGIHYIVNNEIVHMDVPTRSLYLVSQHIPLSGEEAQAIRYHDGQYISENHTVANRESNLTLLLQYADNWSGLAIERLPKMHSNGNG